MKTMLALFIAFSGLLISTSVFASCNDASCYYSTTCGECGTYLPNNPSRSCCEDYSTGTCGNCGSATGVGCDSCANYSAGCDNGCGTSNGCDPCGTSSSQYAYGYARPCDCDCTDNGWRYNDCITKCEYCEAFGNIGAR